MSKKLLYFCMVASLIAGHGYANAGVSGADTEPVYTSDPMGTGRVSRDYRPGEVIVKLRSESSASLRKVKGKNRVVGSAALDKVFAKYGVSESSALMPLSGATVSRKKPRAYNGQTVADNNMSKLYCVSIVSDNPMQVLEMVNDLKALPEVEYAEPNYVVRATVLPSETYKAEPLYSQFWGPAAIGLEQLWDQPITGVKNPVIAILDTGVDIEHPDLKANIWTNTAELNGSEGADDDNNGFADDIHGYDFVNQTGRMRDNNGHGTHCAGIAAACGNNGIGLAGANPDALIMPVTILQSDGSGDVATIIKGIDYAIANGAEIISMSFGGYADSMAEREALAKAYQKAVLVAAAGNDNKCIYPHTCPVNRKQGSPMFPAAYNFVLGVQSTSDAAGTLSSFSNYDDDGPVMTTYSEKDLFNYELKAPGSGIMSTFPNGQYRKLSGTSMACPLVAGAISRLMQCKEYTSKEELFGDLIHSSNGNVNFSAAYGIKDTDRKPTLSMVTYRLDDEKMGDGDGIADAGETIRIYPTFRNDWGNANNITYTVELSETEDPNILEFIDSDPVHTVSNLSSYATVESEAPFVIKISPDCVDGRRICMVLKATCDNISAPLEQEIVLTVENGVELGGILREDMILTPDKNYIVTSLLGVPEGRTLTILPGTTLKFKDDTGLNVAGTLIADGEPGKMITFTKTDLGLGDIKKLDFGDGEVSYCVIEDLHLPASGYAIDQLNNSIISNYTAGYLLSSKWTKSNILYSGAKIGMDPGYADIKDCNIIQNDDSGILTGNYDKNCIRIHNRKNCNIFSNYSSVYDKYYSLSYYSGQAALYTPVEPCYLGTSRQDIARDNVFDIHTPGYSSFGELDLSNMLTKPVAEAHGIVWKVVVNGYDAQDEYEQMPPLGVGEHEVKVYFNRPMNKAVEPMIAMGVRPPYTQTSIGGGSWNEAGDIYTAKLTIMGRDNIDGVNTIYVSDAQDNEFFPIPVENRRFRVNVQSAGSMSNGFEATAGLGKVDLTWESPEEHVNDLLGYNLYRYSVDDTRAVSDTVRINPDLLDKEEFTDYDVVPGTTYCYYYKVMTTALSENSPSKVVAVTPLTAAKGDANGSMDVDVSDIVTEVAYMLGQNPQPFIFDAADVNADAEIDILDVVGTVNIINKVGAADASAAATASYWIKDGILYVESANGIAGVQVHLNGIDADTAVTPLDGLNGFETMGDMDEQGNYLFLGFSLSGKSISAGSHALLRVGNASIDQLVLSDSFGKKIMAADATNFSGVGALECMQMGKVWPVPFVDVVNVPVMIGKEGMHRVELELTSLSGAVVLSADAYLGYGENMMQLNAGSVGNGFYLLSMKVDGRLMQTVKVIKK